MAGKHSYEAPDGSYSYAFEVRENLLVGVAKGVQRADDAKVLIAMLEEVRKELGDEILWLSDAEQVEGITPEARKLMTEYTMGKTSPFKRIALTGPNALIRTIINLFTRISRVPVRVFEREEDALHWLEVGDS